MRFVSSILPSTRRVCAICLCALFLTLHGAASAGAQETEPAADPSGPENRAVVEAPSKSYVLEGIIFAALCGAALYAVCRSSPRGT